MQAADEILKTKRFIAFIQEARRFCHLIEQNSVLDNRSFLKQIQACLQKLYLCGQEIPVVNLNFDQEFVDTLTETELEKVSNSISQRIGNKTLYWIVFDPTDERNTEPVCGDLVDDIWSVYKDLKNGIILFDKGSPSAIENAIWSFKSSFDIHWSDHCINAIYALHYFIQHAS